MLKKLFRKIKPNIYLTLIKKALNSKTGREIILNQLDKKVYEKVVEEGSKNELKEIQRKKYQWIRAVLKQGFKNYEKGYISYNVIEKLTEILGFNNFFKDDLRETAKAREAFRKKHNAKNPPGFVMVSPTQICNLRCKGCYAASSSETAVTMPFDVLDRIFKESHDIFGSRFGVISGGEPLMYQSQGKTIFDIFEKYNDTFFLIYTNGTLITKEVAEKFAKLKNAMPQISVEGFEKETDERRGKGIFQRILKAMENLREVGMPFAISVTGTRENMNALLSDEFYDFWFEKQGASYMWLFQFMPIGRGKEVFDLMPTPEERVRLYRKWEKLLEDGYPIADFWNSGILADGCIAFGREGGGYLYIDWNGNIMPCVFIPYYVDNIYDLYNQGKTLEDALFSDFFKKGREWQKKYGYACPKKPENWLMPCAIRDHHKYFRENILPENAKGEDKFAEEAKNSKEYYEGFIEYDKELEKLTQPIWEKEFLEKDQ